MKARNMSRKQEENSGRGIVGQVIDRSETAMTVTTLNIVLENFRRIARVVSLIVYRVRFFHSTELTILSSFIIISFAFRSSRTII